MAENTERLGIAQDFFQKKEFQKALEACQQILKEAPDNTGALSLAARILALAGQYGKAAPLIEKAIRLAPQDISLHQAQVEILFNTSKLLAKNRNYEPAVQFAEQALKAAPGAPEILFHLCLIYLELSKPEAIIKTAKQALEKHPDHVGFLGLLGNALRSVGETKESTQVLKRTAALAPKNTRVQAGLASSMMQEILDADSGDDAATVSQVFRQAIRALLAAEEDIPSLSIIIRCFCLYTQKYKPSWQAFALALEGELMAQVNQVLPGVAQAFAENAPERVASLLEKAPYSRAAVVLSVLLWRAYSILCGENVEQLRQTPLPLAPFTKFMCDDTVGTDAKRELLFILGLRKQDLRAWNQFIFETYAVPVMAAALDAGLYWLARVVEETSVFSYGMQPHDFTQPDIIYRPIMPLYETAAEKIKSSFVTHTPPAPKKTPLVALVLLEPLGQWANARIIMGIMTGLKKAQFKDAAFFVITLSGVHKKEHQEECVRNGIQILDIAGMVAPSAQQQDTGLARIRKLREVIQQLGVDAIILDSYTQGFAQFLAGLRLIDVQIFLNMNWFNIGGPMWDGLITLGYPVKSLIEFKGNKWRVGPVPILEADNIVKPNEKTNILSEAEAIRKELLQKHSVILGTVSRADKINNDAFMETLAAIMRENPGACFLWFGKEVLPEVKEKMETLGIAERCLFQGWVDAQVYVRVLDVHLDAFPYPGGLTIYDSMRAGAAVVMLSTPESRRLGLCSVILPFIEGEGTEAQQNEIAEIFQLKEEGKSLLPIAYTTEEYVALASRMITDAAFRKAAGGAGRKYIEAFKEDDILPATTFAQHVLEIIQQKRAAVDEKIALAE